MSEKEEVGFGESIEEPMIDSDDWDLGPACGLDPEVCESCQ